MRLVPEGPPGRVFLPEEVDSRDEAAMDIVIGVAARTRKEGLPPFGCLVTNEAGLVLALTWGTGTRLDPTAHSEVSAIKLACERSRGLLYGCTLYSTHEPCPMCCGAIVHAKLARMVWGSARADLPALFAPRLVPPHVRLTDTETPPRLDRARERECVALFGGMTRWDHA